MAFGISFNQHYEISINQFCGTPLFALAQNANVNGGGTLSKTEFAIMQQQMKNLGMTFEEYGLIVESEDLEGRREKQTRNNIAEIGNNLNKAYKKQFGSKNNVSVAQTAEIKADAIIKTALDIFKSEHPDVLFTPKSLGSRPQFTQPKYKDKSAIYAMDLSDWANSVKLEYINATKLSNEALAALIINNNNKNTDILSEEMLAYANALLLEVDNGTALILNTIQDAEGNIIKTIRSAEGHIARVVKNAKNEIIGIVKEEGVRTRNTVREVGAEIINDNRIEHTHTRNLITNEAALTRNVVRNEAFRNRLITKVTAKETQEIDAMNSAIAERLDSLCFTETASQRIGDMQKQITEANIPHEVKMELLQRIRNQIDEMITSSGELDDLQDIINKRIDETSNYLDLDKIPPLPEFPIPQAPPVFRYPNYEKVETEEKNSITIPAQNRQTTFSKENRVSEK